MSDYPSAANPPAYSVTAERLEGVRTRRMLAFLFDYAVVILLACIAALVVFFLGILTFGLAWLLYSVLWVLVVLAYVATTMGGPQQSTLGMRFFSLRIEREEGGRVDGITAMAHTVLFWVIHILGTPFMLLVSVFSAKKRLLQDILLGTIVVRSDR